MDDETKALLQRIDERLNTLESRVPEPPTETPPAETPPAETPPAETPPAETPPAETPTVIEQRTDKPAKRKVGMWF